MRNRSILHFLCLLSVALFLIGCGARGATTGKPVSSGGTVTLDDVPLEGATIVFMPEGGTGQAATAISGSGGLFRLTTRNTGDGAVPGNYKVTVKKQGAGGDAPLKPGTPEYDAKMKGMMKGGPPKPGPAVGGIHQNYTEANKTPLKFEIPSGGDTSLQIKLNKSGT